MTNGKPHFMARTVGEDMDDSNEKSEEEVIDVETSSDTVSSTKKLSNLLADLCDESSSIKAVLCSSLSQTSLQNISANNMCGQGKNKVKKEYLANSALSLLRITEAITPIIIGSNKELELESLAVNVMDKEVSGVDPNELFKIASNIDQQIKLIDARLESANLEFANSTKTLKELLGTLENTRSENTVSHELTSAMKPNTVSPNQRLQNNKPPCDPYVAFINDAITTELRQDLLKFIDSQTFSAQETCDRIYFGDYGYYSTTGRYEARPLPPILSNLLHYVQSKMPNPSMNSNSCMITRYKGGSKYSPH